MDFFHFNNFTGNKLTFSILKLWVLTWTKLGKKIADSEVSNIVQPGMYCTLHTDAQQIVYVWRTVFLFFLLISWE